MSITTSGHKEELGRSGWRSLRLTSYLFLLFGLFSSGFFNLPRALAANATQLENANPGTIEWQLTKPASEHQIEGYASLTSVNRGEQIKFFVSTVESSYTIEFFRMGWYGGTGARRMTPPQTRAGIHQAIPDPDTLTGLVECHWTEPYVLTVPDGSIVPGNDGAGWPSGIYLAKLTAGQSGQQSYIIFVVRDDTRNSAFLFQSSVTTYQAYNDWGGASFYTKPRARLISFDRPYRDGNGAGQFNYFFRTFARGWEYNMVRWLEREGYDVAYCTDIDTHANPGLLLTHRGFLCVAHDEYWSWEMRRNIEAARDQGVSLGFFSGNTCYWQIRIEPNQATGAPNRTLVSYKYSAQVEDPVSIDDDPANDSLMTTLWRNAPVQRPEDALLGVMYTAGQRDQDMVIADASHWACAGSGLHNGSVMPGLIGPEEDRMYGHAPAGTALIAHSPMVDSTGKTDYADMTAYTAPSGATVFAAGTIQWSWGLDDYNAPRLRTPRRSAAAQQITRNVLSRFLRGAGQPVITGFTPASGPVGTSVSITGNNLAGATGVLFNGVSANFTVVSATKITATVPAGAASGPISVTSPSGTANSAGSFAVTSTVIVGFAPAGAAIGGTVVISGSNFAGATKVTFHGTSATFRVDSATQITATVPPGATSGPIGVVAPAGTAASVDSFSITPRLNQFSPSAGAVGTSVSITGVNFSGMTNVFFNGIDAGFTIISATKITAIVPAGAASGLISVISPGGMGNSANSFTVTSTAITSFAPLNAKIGGTVVVSGSNFSGASKVTFNDINATFRVNSATQITATVPPGATTGPIGVVAPAGTAASGDKFLVTPFAKQFDPDAGAAGTSVIVTGLDFTGATAVKFNGVNAAFQVDSATQITAKVPAGAASGPISVSTLEGTAATELSFHVWPSITSFSPLLGSANTTVTLQGANLSDVTAVRFNGVSAVFTINSATSLTAIVPANAMTGKITVISPFCKKASKQDFTIVPALVISNPLTAYEGNPGSAGSTTFAVNLSSPATQTVTVEYQTANGTAEAGSDYIARSGTLTFAPGETVKYVKVSFIGDNLAELNETFFVDLRKPVNAKIADSRGSVYIRNDDGPGITIHNAKTADEGHNGTTAQTFSVTLSAASPNTVTVAFATANGTAGPADFTVTSGTLTFAPGETAKTITVLLKGDAQVEPTETYKVNLTNPTYATLVVSQGIAYIRNDDGT